MKQRKGYGIGQGQGYKNLMPMDSYVHSLSAKGVKTSFQIDYYGDNPPKMSDIKRAVNLGNLDEEGMVKVKRLNAKKTKREWAEDIYLTCPNCGVEVKGVHYDDEKLAYGSCEECATDFETDKW